MKMKKENSFANFKTSQPYRIDTIVERNIAHIPTDIRLKIIINGISLIKVMSVDKLGLLLIVYKYGNILTIL
jgi:hypothetical protein